MAVYMYMDILVFNIINDICCMPLLIIKRWSSMLQIIEEIFFIV